jgi:hypothetical protein
MLASIKEGGIAMKESTREKEARFFRELRAARGKVPGFVRFCFA